MTYQYERELELAKMAAKEAGDFLKRREEIHVDASEGKDIKLSSDKYSEKIIIDRLKETEIPILSEECGRVNVQGNAECSGAVWIIDPLDGTANYWKGLQELACVSIALWKDSRPVLGVVYRFFSDELYHGIVGQGAFLNGEPIHTSDVTETEQAIVATGFPVHRDYGTESLSVFINQVQNFKKVRMLGAAAVMGTFVAVGKVDAYMEDEIMLWDVAAAAALVLAAGGEASVELLDDDKCICKCFATRALMEDYYAKSL